MRRKEPGAGEDRRVDVGGVTLVWGERSRWKATFRDESLKRHLERPVAERLRAAFSLVLPRRPDERRTG
jgi:hypothetical protein